MYYLNTKNVRDDRHVISHRLRTQCFTIICQVLLGNYDAGSNTLAPTLIIQIIERASATLFICSRI